MREKGFEAEEVNFARTGLDAATVKAIVAAAGGVAKVVNGRHPLAKERGWVASPPSVAEFAAAVAADVNLLRRPILLAGKTVLVGYDKTNKDAWAKL